MKHDMRWLLGTLALTAGLGACGSLPDWGDVQKELAAAAAGGPAETTAGATSSGGATATAGAGNAGGALPAGGSANTAGASTAGAGGAPEVAGSSGAAQAGAGGAMLSQDEIDQQELASALNKLNGFVYQSPCKFSNNGSDVTTLNGCNTSDICWSTQDLGQYSEKKTIAIDGTTGHTYQIDLNVLGVIEPRDYPAPPNCVRLPGQPAATAGMAQCMDGFANKNAVTFNVWEFSVPAPAAKYYLNANPTHPPHRVDIVDNKFTFQVNAGTTINFTMDDLNGGEIRNCTNTIGASQFKTADGKAISAPPTNVVSQPYNGQWFQLSVLDAKVLH